MSDNDNQDWRTTNVPWQTIWVLAVGTIVALALASRPALAAPDGMGGVFGGIFSGQVEGHAKVVASPELVQILEAAPDGVVTEIRKKASDDGEAPVTYLVEPRSTFSVGRQNCRTFTVNAKSDDEVRETFRIACRNDQGAWHIAATPLGALDGGANN